MIRIRLIAALLTGAVAWGASAEDAAVEQPVDAPPEVPLNDLLGLPSGYAPEVERRGGATQGQWRDRFVLVRDRIQESKRLLAKAEKELDSVSETSSAWQVAAPGSSDPQTSPLSLRLREEVRGHRESIEVAERELRALDVQADLASVPQEWRE